MGMKRESRRKGSCLSPESSKNRRKGDRVAKQDPGEQMEKQNHTGNDTQTRVGRFVDGPLIGADYSTPTGKGVSDAVGAFRFRDGERVAWSIGRLSLGTSEAKDRITPADLVPVSCDHPSPLTDQRVINRARFLHSLASETDLARGILISPAIRAEIDPAADRINFDQDEDGFTADPSVRRLFEKLGLRLRSAEESRNHLRRSMAGIKKIVDVKVPTRDGSYLLADIYRPLDEGRYPVILRLSVYGKAFGSGSICSHEDYLRSEEREDAWFQGAPQGPGPESLRYAENVVSANTMDWVPRGYVLVRVDCRGVGRTPGVLNPFSKQEAEDYFDVIEWAAVQPWSNGKVGLHGASYAATIQWNVAALGPPSLKAMIPWTGDADSYRDLSYPGGIFNEGYRRQWWANLLGNSCGAETVNLIDDMLAHPFDEPEFYGPQGNGPLSADFNRHHHSLPDGRQSDRGLACPGRFRGF